MRKAFIKLHLSIFLAGFTGLLGKLILLSEVPLVWYRMLITAVLFLIYLVLTGGLRRIAIAEALKISGVGMVLALHWIFFYGSIKYANVSVGVVCFALVGFFTALFEPLAFRRRIALRDVCLSLLTLLGIALIFHFDTRYRTGIILGVISAALAASFTIANKVAGARHDSQTLLLWQMLGGVLFLSLTGPAYLHFFPEAVTVPTSDDLIGLFLLASLCTIGMYLLQLQALQVVSAFTVSLSYNLEPVYSIILAMLFLGEASELGPSFYIGLAFICASVVLQTGAVINQRRTLPASC